MDYRQIRQLNVADIDIILDLFEYGRLGYEIADARRSDSG